MIEIKLTETKKLKAEFRDRATGELITLDNPIWRSSNPAVLSLEPNTDGTCEAKPAGAIGMAVVSYIGMTENGMAGGTVDVHVTVRNLRGGGISVV